MNKSLGIIFLLLFFSLVPVMAEQMTLEVIPLQNRMADDVVPILRPLVTPGGTITGMNNQLIIKTTPDNLAEIKHVLQSLDRSPRKLMITVKQDSSGSLQSNEQSLTGKYSSGNISIANKDKKKGKDGLTLSAEDDEGNNISYRTIQKNNDFDDRNSFRVQAIEGYPAFIQTGQSVPIRSQTAYATPGGVVINENVEYHDASSGFYVLPRLNGDRVTLFVAPRLSSVQPGQRPVFDTQSVETTAVGNLGEWMRIGGIDQSFSEGSNRTLSSSSSGGLQSSTVLIRVDEIK